MSLPIKAGIGVLTVGTVGGVGYGIVAYSQKGITINKLIEEKYEYVLLSTTKGPNNTDKSHWTTNWEKYKSDNLKLNTDIFSLDGWKKPEPDDLTEKLKEKCEELAKTTVYDEGKALYENFTKYCGRGVTFAEQAKKEQITILDTTKAITTSDIWTKKYNDRAQITGELEKLSMKDPASADKIKEGCGKAKDNNKQITNYQAVYDAFKKVCTK